MEGAGNLTQQYKHLRGKHKVMSSIRGTKKEKEKKREREMEGDRMSIKRIKMCYVRVPIPYDECNYYSLQMCTNKNYI